MTEEIEIYSDIEKLKADGEAKKKVCFHLYVTTLYILYVTTSGTKFFQRSILFLIYYQYNYKSDSSSLNSQSSVHNRNMGK